MNFNGPIPGESLTREPGNAPWEQPPQYPTVQEALAFYLDKFGEDDEVLDDTLFLLDQDFPLDLLVESLLLNGEMAGKHTFDVSFLVGPVLHEHLLTLAKAAGVTVREFQGDNKSEKQKKKTISDLQVILNKSGTELAQEVGSSIEEAVTNDVQIELPTPQQGKGLVSRRS